MADRITQEVLEVGVTPDIHGRITQEVLEVGITTSTHKITTQAALEVGVTPPVAARATQAILEVAYVPPPDVLYPMPVYEAFGAFPVPALQSSNLTVAPVTERDPVFPAIRWVSYLILQGRDVVTERDPVFPAALLSQPGGTGNLRIRFGRDHRGAEWGTEYPIDDHVDANSAGAVWMGNRFGAMYSQTGLVQWQTATDPETWSGPVQAVGPTGKVQGLAINEQGVLCGFVGDTPWISRDGGQTWAIGGFLAGLSSRPRTVTALRHLFVVVQPDGVTVRHWISADAGQTWI